MVIRPDNKDEFTLAGIADAERVRDAFPYNYLPVKARHLLREAFACYNADLLLAFAVLCRRTVAATGGSAPDQGQFRNLFDDAIELGQIDGRTRDVLREALFGAGTEPEITGDQAAILIEVVKDMFFQRYVRTAKLRRAIQVRQLFADGARAPD